MGFIPGTEPPWHFSPFPSTLSPRFDCLGLAYLEEGGEVELEDAGALDHIVGTSGIGTGVRNPFPSLGEWDGLF